MYLKNTVGHKRACSSRWAVGCCSNHALNKTLQSKVPPPMLGTSWFCSLGRCYRHARCPKNDPGFQRKCKAKYDYLRCPSYPTTFTIPTFTSEATNRDAQELVVRRTIFRTDLCRISRHQISVRFFVQHLLVSTTEARVTSWRACRKNDLDNSSVAKRPEHRQEHLLFVNTKKNHETWMSKVGRTNAAWLQKVAVTSPYRAVQKNFLGVDQKPYIRCNTWALMPF